jgi:hypothetical protein
MGGNKVNSRDRTRGWKARQERLGDRQTGPIGGQYTRTGREKDRWKARQERLGDR